MFLLYKNILSEEYRIVPFSYKNRWLIPLVLSSIILISDQITKLWIVQLLGPEPVVKFKPLIGDWFRLVYSHNTGIAFNLFQGASPVFILTSILISGFVLYGYIFHLPNQSLIVQASIGLILGGAFGNTVDRIRVGYVIDFIQVGWWPVFNVADSAITTGAVLLAIYLIFTENQEPEPAPARDDQLLHELLNQDTNGRNPSCQEKS
jgi:signal peptidase II